MEGIFAFLASPAGQALAAAGMSLVLKVANGGDVETAQAEFAQAASTWAQAVKDWNDAKAKTPPPPDA